MHTARILIAPAAPDEDSSSPEITSDDTELDVVVKVQRPNIQKTIEADLSILHFLAKQAVDAIPEVEAFRPDRILLEFERAIMKELDFNHEAHNLSRFEKSFRDWETVHIPYLHRDLSTQRVLVMERLRGKIDAAALVIHG